MLCDPQPSPAWSDEVDKRDGLGRVDVNTMLYTFLLSISLHHWNQELVSRMLQSGIQTAHHFCLLATCAQVAMVLAALLFLVFLFWNSKPSVSSTDQRDFVPSLRNCSPLSNSFGQSSAETILFQLLFPRTLPCLPHFVSRLKRALDLPMQ